MSFDENKLHAFMEKAIADMGAAASATMVRIGDKLGLYKAMSESGPVTVEELAKLTGTKERYLQEWLGNQAAGGYITYEAKTKKYFLPPEQAMALAHEDSPAFIQGGYQVLAAMFESESKMIENFKTGRGLDWGEQHPCLFEGTERFFRSSYIGNLLSAWIPSVQGVEAKLNEGIKVADVGCGLGTSTILMARAFPKSKFYGFDYHQPSIEMARERAQKAGVGDRVVFEVAKSTDYPGNDYDLVCHFDCLHDMGDPVSAGRRVLQSLKKDGTWMIIEPFAGDRVEDNLNPVGRLFYAASTTVCVPASLAQNGIALGAQAGEAKLKEIVTSAGFKHFRRATATPFNLVLEAKP